MMRTYRIRYLGLVEIRDDGIGIVFGRLASAGVLGEGLDEPAYARVELVLCSRGD